MAILNCAEDAIFVDLPAAPDFPERLQEVAEHVQNRGYCDVVMDFIE